MHCTKTPTPSISGIIAPDALEFRQTARAQLCLMPAAHCRSSSARHACPLEALGVTQEESDMVLERAVSGGGRQPEWAH